MKKIKKSIMFSCTILCSFISCSFYIDDFDVEDQKDTHTIETPENTDNAKDSNTDNNTNDDTDTDNTNIETGCNVLIKDPRGNEIRFCVIPESEGYLGCDDTIQNEQCSPDELPFHLVKLSGYIIGQNEITNYNFSQFVIENPDWAKDGTLGVSACSSGYLSNWIEDTPLPENENLPATQICWYAARAYCQWLGDFHIPTEAQWEYAARGPYDGKSDTYHLYPGGNLIDCASVNYQGCNNSLVDIDSTLMESPWGLFNMAGNAMEWTNDGYRSNYYCDPTNTENFAYPNCNTAYVFQDPTGDPDSLSRSLKGGSWYSPPNQVRISTRIPQAATTVSPLIGFRCAR